MIKNFFCNLFFLLTITRAGYCKDKTGFDQLPDSTQNGFKRIASKYHTGPVDYKPVENDLKNSGVDFSKMSIEDAVMMLFMLIAEDARKDMKDQLEEMDAARQRRAAMRQAEELLKKEIDSLKDQARARYRNRADSLQVTEKLNAEILMLQRYNSQEKEAIAAEKKAAEDRTAAEKHLQSAEEAIKKLQQRISRKKQQ